MGQHDERTPVTLHNADGTSTITKPADLGEPNVGKLSRTENSNVDHGKLAAGEQAAPDHAPYAPGRRMRLTDETILAGNGETVVIKPGDAGHVDAGKLVAGERAADGGHGRRHVHAGDGLSISIVRPTESPQPATETPQQLHPAAGQTISEVGSKAVDPAERARLNTEAREIARDLSHGGHGRDRGGPAR